MFKKLTLVLLLGLFLAGCTGKKEVKTPPARQVKQLINALEVTKRPFLAVFPHSSSKLLTLYLDRVGDSYKQSSIDLEYLSGNSLKGGRTTIDLPKPMPHAQAFLLGSCSSGGKCSFDTDLISGTLKNKLDDGGDTINVLKSDFVFVTKGAVSTTDGRVNYTPTNPKQKDQILMDTQGLPQEVSGELAYAPIAISTVDSKKVSGQLKFNLSGIKQVLIYDGSNFAPIKFTEKDGSVIIEINQAPWNKAATIIRDDLKGSTETAQLYLLGPIVVLK